MANIAEKIISLVIKGKDLFSAESAKTEQALKDLRAETTKTRDELKELTKSGEQVDKALDLKATLDEQKKAMDAATTAVKEHAQSVDAAADSVKKQRVELTSLRSEHSKQNKALTRARAALRDHTQALNEGEQASESFKQRSSDLTAKIDEQKKVAASAKTAVETLAKTIADSATVTAQTRVQTKALNKELATTTKEYNNTAKQLGKTLVSLDKAGVNTKNLADEQQRLADASVDLTDKMDDLRTSVKRLASDIQLDEKLDEQSIAVRRAIDALDDYSRELNRNGSINDEQARQQQRLTDSAEKMVREYRKGADALAQHIMTLQAAGEETSELEREQQRLAKTAKVLADRLDSTRKEAAKASGTMETLRNGVKAASSGVDGFTRNLLAMGAAYAGINLVTTTLSKFFQTAGQMEDFRYQLVGVFNDVEKGEAAYDWVVDFTKTVPNKLEDVTQAFIMLHNQGMNPQDGTLKKIIAANAKYGKGVETLIPIIRQLTQSWAKNRIQAEEVYVLVENGIPVWDMLAKVTGKTVGQLQKMSEQGRLTRTELKLLLDEMGNSSMAAMETRMGSFNAMLAKMSDRINQILDTIARSGSLNYFKQQLDEIGDSIDKLAANGELQKMAREVSEAMVNTASAIKSLIITTYEWGDAIKAVAVAAVGLKLFSMFKDLAGIIKPLTPAITSFSTAAVASLGKAKVAMLGLYAAAGWGLVQIVELGKVTYDLIDANDQLIASEQLKADTEKRMANILAEYSNQLGIQIRSIDEYNALLSRGTIVIDQFSGKVMLAATYHATLEERMAAAASVAKNQLTPTIEKMINDFRSMKDRGDTVNTMLKTIFGTPEQLTSVGHLLDMAVGLREVEKAGILTAEQLEDGLGSVLEKLSGADLMQFQQMAMLAFKSVETGSINASHVLSTSLTIAMQKLGLDVKTVNNEMTALGHDSINTLHAIAQNSETSSASLYAAAQAALALAKTETDVNLLVQTIVNFGKAGQLSADQVNAAILQASGKVVELTAKTNALEQALSRLGVDSMQALQTSLNQTEADYNALVEAQKRGEASAYQVSQAYLAWAEASMRLSQVSGQQVDSMVVLKGASMGLNAELSAMIQGFQQASGNSQVFEQSLDNVAFIATTTAESVSKANAAIADQTVATNDSVTATDKATQAQGDLANGLKQTSGAGDFLAGMLGGIYDDLNSLSAATYNYYSELVGLPFASVTTEAGLFREEVASLEREIVRLSTARIATDPIQRMIMDHKLAAAQAKHEYLEQANSLDKLMDKLSDTGNVTQDLIDRADGAGRSFDLLNESSLDGLKSAVRAAQQQMEQMEQSAQSTLSSLKQELAGLNGDIVEQERLRLDGQRAKLEADLAAAKAAKNKDAVRELQQALKTFDEIEKKRMADAKQQKQDQIDAEKQAAADVLKEKEDAKKKEKEEREKEKQAAADAIKAEKEAAAEALKERQDAKKKEEQALQDEMVKRKEEKLQPENVNAAENNTATDQTAPLPSMNSNALTVVEVVKFDITIGNKSSIAYTVPSAKNDLFDMLQNLKNISM